MARWIKGESGNPRGRPRNGTAVAVLARSQVEKHKLVEKLGRIGARAAEYSDVSADQQLRAIQLLLAYGYGPPRPEIDGNDGIVIQVTYAETNRVAIDGAACSATTGDPGGQAVQRGLLRAPLGQDRAGNGPVDSPGTEGPTRRLV